ncbi:MAG TPA: GTP-binding protein [Clostridiaceae bacterium]
MENTREVLRIVTVGHVDHGKSTVIGRLLYDTKSLPEGAIDRVKKIAKEKGKPFEYAYLLDAFEEEQKQGITIDTTSLQFHTDKRDYVIIDAPGHVEFLKNMITGAASAEAALLIIDANEGIQEQSKRHGYILSLLGISQVYVVVNKMDLIDYNEEKFNVIKKEMNRFLSNLNVHPLKYIPISAFYGENLTSRSDKTPWYKGESVLEAMDLFSKEKGFEDKPLRFPIQDVYKFDNRRIIAGRIETGRLSMGDEVLISPENKVTKVKSIEYFAIKDKRNTVEAGLSVGITFEDEFFNKRGEFITHKEEAPLIGNIFTANIFWMGKNNFIKGKKYKIKLVTQEVECEIVTFNKVIDATTLGAYENANEAKTNDVAEVTIKTKEKICFDRFADNQNTGRFVIVDGYDVSGGGIISGLVTKTKKNSVTFTNGAIKLQVNCFDEYYYELKTGQIKKKLTKARAYKTGDYVPYLGETYSYEENFDLIALEERIVAKIRVGKLIELLPIEDYKYEETISVNKNGFAINIFAQKDLGDLTEEYTKITNEKEGLEDFSNRWLDLNKNRTIKFKTSME